MMMEDRTYNVLIKPHMSEKSMLAADSSRQIVFHAVVDATKREIKQAVEKLFNVKVEKVTTIKVKGKMKTFKQKASRRKSYKKAYVSLAEGHDIDFMGAE